LSHWNVGKCYRSPATSSSLRPGNIKCGVDARFVFDNDSVRQIDLG
jgi:hypothetical protein